MIVALESQPLLQRYIDGVSSLQAAIDALPDAIPLTTSLANLEGTAPLPPFRETLLNVTTTLLAAVQSLPSTAGVYASLAAINRSKAELPPLIDDALAAIIRHHTTGISSRPSPPLPTAPPEPI